VIERIVLDTNILVSAFLNPSGAPAQVLTLLLAGDLTLLFDQRILAEYAEVPARPRFALDATDVAEVLRQLEADREHIITSASATRLPDADDLPAAVEDFQRLANRWERLRQGLILSKLRVADSNPISRSTPSSAFVL